ncbi:MAG: hypothetical protein WB245_12815 [Acidimicrobiia bacterium]
MPHPGHAIPVSRAKGQVVGPCSNGAIIASAAIPMTGPATIRRSRHARVI